MHILLIAPQPFYQERGTPIAVKLLLQALSVRGDTVDVLTLAEGTDVTFTGVTLHRIPRLPGLAGVRPGFSLKKLVCDVLLGFKAIGLLRRNRYDVIHAVEESAFMARWFKRWFHIPYVFDMDSCMSQQIVEKNPRLRWLLGLVTRLERSAVREAAVAVPVCDDLAAIAQGHGAKRIVVLRDISLLSAYPEVPVEDLRATLGIQGFCFMYIGNLERYQGIDLFLESLALLIRSGAQAHGLIVGGTAADIAAYQRKATDMGLGTNAHFVGPRPIGAMKALFAQADALVSPRIQGNNTPMKVYSYLDSGKPVVATRLPTHTQVLTDDVAVLAEPVPEAFAEGLRAVMNRRAWAAQLAQKAKQRVLERHSYTAFEKTVRELYAELGHTA